MIQEKYALHLSILEICLLVFVEGAGAVDAVILVQGRLFLIYYTSHPLDYTFKR